MTDYTELVKELRENASNSRDLYIADAIEELFKAARKMHTWIFLHTGDEQKAYDECGLSDEMNAALGYSGQFVATIPREGKTDKKSREQRAYRRYKKRQKTKRLMDITNRSYINSIWFDWDFDEEGHYVRTGTYPKRAKNSHQKQFYKNYSNRIIRRNKTTYQNGDYRKVFDYRWTID